MVRFIGSADLPGFCVKYFVFGNPKDGYGIRILSRDGNRTDRYVSRRLTEVLNLARMLMRGVVFPENLCEILEDLLFEAQGVDK